MRASLRSDARDEAEQAAFRLEKHIFYYVSLILARRNKALNAALKPFGIDHSRWRVLAVLNEHAGCSMLELAEHSSVDRTTLAHTVRLMCEEGLVSRARHPTDRRRSILNLSKKGQGLLRSVLPLVVAQNEAAVRSLGRAEADTLLALLVRVADTLKSDHTGRRRRPH